MRIGVASDHAGFRYKTLVAEHLRGLGHDVEDFGTKSEEPVDYPDFIRPLAIAVAQGDRYADLSHRAHSSTVRRTPGISCEAPSLAPASSAASAC